MKIRSFLTTALTTATITAIAATNLPSVTAEVLPNRGQLLANSQLSQTQIDRLKSLGTKVAVPTSAFGNLCDTCDKASQAILRNYALLVPKKCHRSIL